jgi:hypothetical protein
MELILKDINLSINQSNKDSSTFSNEPKKKSIALNYSKQVVNPSASAIGWSEKQVEDWFKEKNVNTEIVSIIRPCDGELLHQLYTMLVGAPEFFYQSISKKNTVDLRTALVFSLCLKKLFES